MRKYIVILFCSLFGMNSCNYLDVDPELGIDEEDIFSSYKNFKAYFNVVYYGTESDYDVNLTLGFPLQADIYTARASFYQYTDMADAGRLITSQNIKRGTMGDRIISYLTIERSRSPISKSMFQIIRICNRTI